MSTYVLLLSGGQKTFNKFGGEKMNKAIETIKDIKYLYKCSHCAHEFEPRKQPVIECSKCRRRNCVFKIKKTIETNIASFWEKA